MITFIYAQDRRGAIGYQNDLPWHLPADLQHFKRETMGHTMLMGRKTFEAMDCRLLPGRKSVVLTTQTDYGQNIEDLELVHDVEEALKLAQDQELMVIGGAGVFKAMAPYADRVIRTVIDHEFEADAFMPELDPETFDLVEVHEVPATEQNPYDQRYEYWLKKEKH